MGGVRRALIVATDEYGDPKLTSLNAPANDARALAEVLRDEAVGCFGVQTVLNRPSHEVELAIAEFFGAGKYGDTLLAHFSCHGVKSPTGELYFATTDTNLSDAFKLKVTGVPSALVRDTMEESRASLILCLVDCCYSGAFVKLAKAADTVDLTERLGGKGRAVITASTSLQLALDGEEEPSLFTRAVIDGLRSGEADRDLDGLVSLDELYSFVHEQVTSRNPNQTPVKSFDVQGEVYVARRSTPVTRPAPLDPDLLADARALVVYKRLGAVTGLGAVLDERHPGRSLAARLELARMAGNDDSLAVRGAAQKVLDAAGELPTPAIPDYEPTVATRSAPAVEDAPVPNAAPDIDSTDTETRSEEWTPRNPTPPNPTLARGGDEQEPVTEPLSAVREERHGGVRTGPPVQTRTKPSSEPAAGLRSRLTDKRPLLLGLGGVAAVAVLAGSAYALMRDDDEEAATQTSVMRVVPEDVILVSIVEKTSDPGLDPDPELYGISVGVGGDPVPVPGLRGGSQSLPSQSRDGGLLVYRWAPDGTGWPASGQLMVAAHGEQSFPLFTTPPPGLLCWKRVGWSPSDARVVLACQKDENGNGLDDSPQTEVYTANINADGQVDPDNLRREFGPEDAGSRGSVIGSVGYTRDGRIVADFGQGENPGVYLTDPGGTPERLTTQDAHDTSPSSTDDLIAFEHNGDLYVASVDTSKPPCPSPGERSTDPGTGTSLCNLTPSNGSVQDPSWSWTGKSIAYRDGAGGSTLQMIGLNGSSSTLSDQKIAGALAWGPR
jgi:hypothetical protein